MVDDLSDPWAEIRRLRRDVDRLQTATPLQSASIGRGGLRVYGGGVITIQNGGLSVTGFATISGELNGDGTINWTGPVNFSGPVTITGTLDVSAATRLRGETTIEGIAKLLSELQVEGKITAGNVTVEKDVVTVGGGPSPATLRDGALGFGTGGKVEADTVNGGVRMIVGTSRVYAGAGAASIQAGSQSILVTPSGIFTPNLNVIEQSLLPEPMAVGALYITTSGEWLRVVAG